MYSRTAVLVANAVSTVTLDRDYDLLEVLNVDGLAAVYFTFTGVDPTIDGNDTYLLPAAIGGIELHPYGNPRTTQGPTTGLAVKLISAGTPKVHVRGDWLRRRT